MNADIIISPAYEFLKEEIEGLRSRLADLVLERDELKYVICRNIEAEYMLKIGEAEYRAFAEQCRCLRLKRKAEMIQAKHNRQEAVNLKEIEDQLDNEFQAYQKQMAEKVQKMNEALEHKYAKSLSEKETDELKKLYHDVVKKLHPDMHPEITDNQLRLFQNAVSAYKNGDLAAMRIIHTIVLHEKIPALSKDAMDVLAEEKARINGMIVSIQEEIDHIKKSYPYNQRELLNDPEKTDDRIKKINEVERQYKDAADEYQKHIERMMN